MIKSKTYNKTYFLLCLLLVSCIGDVAFSKYESIADEGWVQTDTLKFEASVCDSATMQGMLAMRIKDSFPYAGLSVVVEQEIADGNKKSYLKDTVTCELINSRGKIQGEGVSRYQYEFPANRFSIADSCTVSTKVYHIMNVDTIPGITEVGFTLKRL